MLSLSSLLLMNTVAAVIYLLLAFTAWRKLSSGSVVATEPSRDRLASAWRWFLLLAFCLNGAALYRWLNPVASSLSFSFALALALMAWLAVGLYWIESLSLSIWPMQVPLLVMAAVLTMVPDVFATTTRIHGHGNAFVMHFVMAMSAYSFFTLAAIQACFMAWLERRLHRPADFSSMRGLSTLPSLLSLERLLFRAITYGFVLLTLVMLSGFVYSEYAWRWDHKTVFSCLSWLIFAILLVGRWRNGWRGRRALGWTMAGFVSLLLAYVGVRFVLEVILHRA